MKKKFDLLGFFLAVVVGAALLCAILLYTFFPRIILPKPDAIALITLTLIALVLNHYLSKRKRIYPLVPVLGALIFGLFPLASCLVTPMDALKLALLGAVIVPVVTFLFDTMTDHLSSGPASKVAPLISAFGLFLAAQILTGII